jgi:hypothetical protein
MLSEGGKMLERADRQVNMPEVVACICDKCGRKTDDEMEMQEFHMIRFTGGYGSVFGDMTEVECDVCQHCLKGMIGDIARTT